MIVWTVEYQVATYSGAIEIIASDTEENGNLENDAIEARARAQLRRESGGSLPFGVATFRVTDKRRI